MKKGAIIASLALMVALTLCNVSSAKEEQEPFSLNRIDVQEGKDIYILKDNETNLEYIVVERYESNNGTTTLAMTPRYKTTPHGTIQIKGWDK